jgi:branched-chain amino acid transport system permease protein
MSFELQQIANAIVLGAVYSLFAIGYALVFSVLGVLNLAHSAVFMWGAMFGLLAVNGLNGVIPKLYVVTGASYDPILRWYGLPTITPVNISIFLALPLAMMGGGLLGVLLDIVAFRPLRRRNAPRISQLISSIGASVLLVSLAQRLMGSQFLSYPSGTLPTATIRGLPFNVTPVQVMIVVVSLALVLLLRLLVLKTRLGQAMRAVAYNARTAELLGINVNQIFRNTFFLAGALAAIAGVFYGINYQTSFFMGEKVALKGLTVIVLGGLGNIPGAVLGGFAVAAIQVFVTSVSKSDYSEIAVFLLLFLILLIRPQGLIGQKEQSRA